MPKAKRGSAALIQQTKDRALARGKARLAELLALIRRRMTEIVESFYDIGEALREILDNKLYGVLGHKSLNALLRAERLFSIRQASKMIAVVRNVPRDQALELGLERAYALVVYSDATPEADSPKQLMDARATLGGKRVDEASLRDMLVAARDVRSKVKASRPATAAQRAKAKAEAALAKELRAILRGAGLTRVDIAIEATDIRVTLPRAMVERLTREKKKRFPKAL